jgi:hypothetical protein
MLLASSVMTMLCMGDNSSSIFDRQGTGKARVYFANAENIVRVPDFVQKQRNFVF